jgi:transcriptional accessory protein Tex/SPT6
VVDRARRYRIGQLVEAAKLAKFGAFARLKDDPEIEGLIHISELSDGHVQHPREAVHEGQLVTLRVVRIDADKRRIGLTLKGVSSARYADSDWGAGEPDPAADPAVIDPGMWRCCRVWPRRKAARVRVGDARLREGSGRRGI